MKTLVFLTATLVATSLASANEMARPQGRQNAGACRGLNLTAAQIQQIKAEKAASLTAAKSLRTEVQAAKAAYFAAVLEKDATLEKASAAADVLADKKAAVRDNKQASELRVLFNIATPDQRPALLKCMARGKQKNRFNKFKRQHQRRGGWQHRRGDRR